MVKATIKKEANKMKYIITSDVHDHMDELKMALTYAKQEGIETVIDAGDFEEPSFAEKVVEQNVLDDVKLHTVITERGSCDAKELTAVLEPVGVSVHKKGDQFTLDDTLAIHLEHEFSLEMEGLRRYSCDSFENIVAGLKKLDSNDELDKVIIFGHSHEPHYETKEDTLMINPGSLGYGGYFIVLDTEDNSVEFRNVKDDGLNFKIGGDSEIAKIRDFRGGSRSDPSRSSRVDILRNGNERFAGGSLISGEYKRIVQGEKSDEELHLIVEHEDNTHQVIWPKYESDCYNGEIISVGKSNSSSTAPLSFILRSENEDGNKEDRLVLVVEEEGEFMSVAYDKISSRAKPIVREETLETYVVNIKGEDQEVWYNDQKIATFDDVYRMIDSGKLIACHAKKEDKNLVTVITNGDQVNESKLYDKISNVTVEGDLVSFNAKEEGMVFPVVNGEELVKTKSNSWSDEVKSSQFVNGQLAYIVDSGDTSTLYHGMREVASIVKEGYKNKFGKLKNIGEKVAVIKSQVGQNDQILLENEVLVEAKGIYDYTLFDGELIYETFNLKEGSKLFHQDGSSFQDYSSIKELNEAYNGSDVQ